MRGLATPEPRPYRLFLFAALALGLLPGFGLGVAVLLQFVGWLPRLDFWAALVQIHGHVQLWGFAGLFIAGVAYHVVPRFVGQPSPGQRTQLVTLALWGGAVVARTAAQCAAAEYGLTGGLTAAAALGLLAGAHFTVTLGRYLVRRDRAWDGFEPLVLSGLGWLVVAALANLALSVEADRDGAALLGGALYEPTLHAALAGFVVAFCLGVTRRAVPLFLGLRPARAFVALAAPLLNAGVAATIGGEVLDWRVLVWLGAGLEAAAAAVFVAGLRLYEPAVAPPGPGQPRQHEAFIRVAYAWLLVGFGLSLWLAIRAAVSGQAPAGTESSAVRHALALGFVSLLIFGMAIRILPVFEGKPLRWPRLTTPALALFAGGAAVRVATEFAAGYGTPLNGAIGLSGFAGLAGFALVALVVVGTISRRAPATVSACTPACGNEAAPALAEMSVAEVIERWPAALDVLVARGFTPLRNPLMRAALASQTTVRGAAVARGVDLETLLDDLRAVAR